ncbi:hypothetical protein LG302_02580 [Halomonas organivorans]
MTTYSLLISTQQPHDDGSQMTEVNIRRDGGYFPRAAQACLHRNHLGEYAFVFVPGDARLINEPARQADYTNAHTGYRTYDFDSHEDALVFLRDLYGIEEPEPEPEPECWLCDGCGEVETYRASDDQPVTVGCPACVQRDRDAVIKHLRTENDGLRRRIAAQAPSSLSLSSRSVPAPLARHVAPLLLPRPAGTTERAAFFDASAYPHPDRHHPRNTP